MIKAEANAAGVHGPRHVPIGKNDCPGFLLFSLRLWADIEAIIRFWGKVHMVVQGAAGVVKCCLSSRAGFSVATLRLDLAENGPAAMGWSAAKSGRTLSRAGRRFSTDRGQKACRRAPQQRSFEALDADRCEPSHWVRELTVLAIGSGSCCQPTSIGTCYVAKSTTRTLK